jgi:hypothetical protein
VEEAMAERLVAEYSYLQTLTLAFVNVIVKAEVDRGEDLETILKYLENHDPVLVGETYLEALRDQTGPSSDLEPEAP